MTVLDIQVVDSGDDGRWYGGTNQFTTTPNNHGAGYVGGSGTTVEGSFFRFVGIPIEQGQVVDLAYMRRWAGLTVDRTVVRTQYRVADLNNAARPTSFAEVMGLPRSAVRVAEHDIPPWSNSANELDPTPPITPLMNHVFNRAGWESGNAVIVLWEDDGSSTDNTLVLRRIRSFDSSSGQYAPTLHIEYTTNTPPEITVPPTVSYGSLTRLGPNNTPAVVSAEAEDAEETGSEELVAEIRTAASGAGTLVATDDVTSGVEFQINIAYNASGISEGTNNLFLRVGDGTAWSDDAPFAVLMDATAPTVGTISHSPDPVTGGG